MTDELTHLLRRRVVLAAIPVLAACGSGGDDGDDAASSPTAESSSPASNPTVSPSGTASASPSLEGTRFATADIPVGGGTIDGEIVVTQPSEGTFKAFDSTCTHQQCAVTKIVDGAILCPCHFSAFDIETGEPVENPERGRRGPAGSALTELTATVDGSDVVVA